MKLPLTLIRELNLENTGDGNPRHIAAASGLVMCRNRFYVVADDELSLGSFPLDPKKPGQLFPLFSGTLPSGKAERKKLKPDIEALVYLPPLTGFANGAMLAIPSGSKPQRSKGALIQLAANDEPLEKSEINFQPLYSELSKLIFELNIEGGVVDGSRLRLFHRGNSANATNALIEFNLQKAIEEIRTQSSLSMQCYLEFKEFKLGHLNDLPLTTTDAAIDKNGEIWFLAATENTESNYLDGAYSGGVIGKLSSTSLNYQEIDCPLKPEGLWIDSVHNQFYVVTDADDTEIPSHLYRGVLPHFSPTT